MKASLRCIVVFLTLGLFTATLAPAADLVLKGATAWKKDYVFNDGFWEFTRQVEKLSGGKIKVDWKGGPEIAPAFEMLSLVQRGVVDVLGSSAAYYTDKYMEGVFPEYFIGTPAVMRNAGITKFFDDSQPEEDRRQAPGNDLGPGRYRHLHQETGEGHCRLQGPEDAQHAHLSADGAGPGRLYDPDTVGGPVPRARTRRGGGIFLSGHRNPPDEALRAGLLHARAPLLDRAYLALRRHEDLEQADPGAAERS